MMQSHNPEQLTTSRERQTEEILESCGLHRSPAAALFRELRSSGKTLIETTLDDLGRAIGKAKETVRGHLQRLKDLELVSVEYNRTRRVAIIQFLPRASRGDRQEVFQFEARPRDDQPSAVPFTPRLVGPEEIESDETTMDPGSSRASDNVPTDTKGDVGRVPVRDVAPLRAKRSESVPPSRALDGRPSCHGAVEIYGGDLETPTRASNTMLRSELQLATGCPPDRERPSASAAAAVTAREVRRAGAHHDHQEREITKIISHRSYHDHDGPRAPPTLAESLASVVLPDPVEVQDQVRRVAERICRALGKDFSPRIAEHVARYSIVELRADGHPDLDLARIDQILAKAAQAQCPGAYANKCFRTDFLARDWPWPFGPGT